MRDVIRCALCGDEIEDPIQTEKGELCEKCIADLLTEQRIVSLPDDVFLKPIVLEEAVVLGKKLLEEMNTLELDDAWDRDYALSVLQDIIGVKTRTAFFEKA